MNPHQQLVAQFRPRVRPATPAGGRREVNVNTIRARIATTLFAAVPFVVFVASAALKRNGGG
jgi:hypothetical protein